MKGELLKTTNTINMKLLQARFDWVCSPGSNGNAYSTNETENNHMQRTFIATIHIHNTCFARILNNTITISYSALSITRQSRDRQVPYLWLISKLFTKSLNIIKLQIWNCHVHFMSIDQWQIYLIRVYQLYYMNEYNMTVFIHNQLYLLIDCQQLKTVIIVANIVIQQNILRHNSVSTSLYKCLLLTKINKYINRSLKQQNDRINDINILCSVKLQVHHTFSILVYYQELFIITN